tara:strand:+ start:3589 stop:3945 length:357 start_codon:yes stop_codon:yes gene_type:complete
MNVRDVFTREMKELIGERFDLNSDETERYDGFRPDETTHFFTLRKIVFPSDQGMPRLVEIYIVRYKLLPTNKMLEEKIWAYYSDGGQLRFQDYRKCTITTKCDIRPFFKKKYVNGILE